MRTLSRIAAISGLYDLVIGAGLLLAPVTIAGWFGVAPPVPLLFVTVAGWLLVVVGVGYWQPYRQPDRHRAYLWVMGPLLKGGGAILFVVDHFARQSPAAFLLFAVTDGALALVTLWALLRAGAAESTEESRRR